MKSRPVEAARIVFDADSPPRAPDFDDIYHSKAGALEQARHVFLRGNGLPERWRGRQRFTILESGFGLGNNFLATWQAWRDDAGAGERLHYIGIDKHPPTQADLRRAQAGSPLRPLADALLAAWPPHTPNFHSLHLDGGRVQLLLGFFDLRDVLPEILAEVDAFYLDGFAPSKNPAMWERRVLKALGRLAASGATAATWSVAREMQAGLCEAGFAVEEAQGFSGKRQMTVARFEPRFSPRRAPARLGQAGTGPVIVIGGGLAGCATAWALAEQGMTSRVIDRHPEPASETSGNAAGLFHGIVTGEDGTHARFNRAAALAIAPIAREAIGGHRVRGEVAGVLRLDDAEADTMQAMLQRLGLPGDYVLALDAAAASRSSGLPLRQSAWFYPQGGWLQPAALARAYLAMAGEAASWQCGVTVAALRESDSGWDLLGPNGHVLDAAPTVVLANAADALRLLGSPAWPARRLRGQTTGVPLDLPGLRVPLLPVAGAGYVIPPLHGRLWCGATSQAGDDDATVRAGDHAHNLAQLSKLMNQPLQAEPSRLEGRTGWRFSADDRLPMLGAVPQLPGADTRLDRPRFVPRRHGLFVHTALGSRGIAWSALGARTLASLIGGSPCPLEASLLDAVDVGRFVSRAARRV